MKNSTAFTLLLISIGIFYTWIMPQYGIVQTLQSQATQYQKILSNVSDLTQKRDQLLSQYRAISSTNTTRLAQVLPDNAATVDLARNFDDIASRYGISLKNVDVITDAQNTSNEALAPSSGNYGTVTVATGFVSTYANFRKFLNDAEHSLRLVDVRSITFSTNSANNLYAYNVSFDTYWLKTSTSTPSQ
jgi:hypothetical protein